MRPRTNTVERNTIREHVPVSAARRAALSPRRAGPSAATRGALQRLSVAAAFAGAALTGPSEARAQGLYPACKDPQTGQCSMASVGPGAVLHGESQYGNAIPVYVIFYGPWNGPVDSYMPFLFDTMLYSISDSSYLASVPTYGDSSGGASGRFTIALWETDASESQGPALNDISIQNLILSWFGSSLDPDGIYLVLPDSTVALTTEHGSSYCDFFGGCGYNKGANISGMDIKYAVAGDPTTPGCTACQWNLHTPNDANGADMTGKLDGELSEIAHELVESVTDPEGAAAGWYSSTSDPNTQSADFCAWNYGSTYSFTLSGSTAFANFRGGLGNFLLQTQRVNANGGSFGYCANEYGGVFWGQDFGLTRNNDWSSGNYKGQCDVGQPLIGLSRDTSSSPKAHAVMCGNGPASPDFQQRSCRLLTFDGSAGTVQSYIDPPPVSDWDRHFYKGECAQNEHVAGVAQSTSGVVNGLYCCAGAVTHSTCEPQDFTSGNVSPQDWDYGYYKAQCNYGQYVAGVSADTTTGSPHRILCCNP